MECLKLDNARYLNTKELTEAERNNRTLDYLGGFELMDSEMRMFIIEGLGGPGNSMEQFYRANERERPNDKKFKMLYNPEVRFKDRLYMDFQVALKKIKLRDPLTKIMGSPDIYLRSKVPEDMYDTLQKFAEMRKLDRATIVRDLNLFPCTTNILTLERKYGDSLNFEDLNGFKKKRRKKRTENSAGRSGSGSDASPSKSRVTGTQFTEVMSQTAVSKSELTPVAKPEDDYESEEEESLVIAKKWKADTDCKNANFEASLKARTMKPAPNFKTVNKERVHSMNTGRPLKERVEIPDGVEVYPYGNQKLNIWEFQKEQL